MVSVDNPATNPNLPQHGVWTFIHELDKLDLSDKCWATNKLSVRIVGRVKDFDAAHGKAVVCDPSTPAAQVEVDARLTGCDHFLCGSLVMIIGDLSVSQDNIMNCEALDGSDNSSMKCEIRNGINSGMDFEIPNNSNISNMGNNADGKIHNSNKISKVDSKAYNNSDRKPTPDICQDKARNLTQNPRTIRSGTISRSGTAEGSKTSDSGGEVVEESQCQVSSVKTSANEMLLLTARVVLNADRFDYVEYCQATQTLRKLSGAKT